MACSTLAPLAGIAVTYSPPVLRPPPFPSPTDGGRGRVQIGVPAEPSRGQHPDSQRLGILRPNLMGTFGCA